MLGTRQLDNERRRTKPPQQGESHEKTTKAFSRGSFSVSSALFSFKVARCGVCPLSAQNEPFLGCLLLMAFDTNPVSRPAILSM